jgi:hypothetical protein
VSRPGQARRSCASRGDALDVDRTSPATDILIRSDRRDHLGWIDALGNEQVGDLLGFQGRTRNDSWQPTDLRPRWRGNLWR